MRAAACWGRRRLIVAGGLVAAAVPLAVALVVSRRPQWYPVLDRAKFELQVRDVGGRNTPLVGPVGRLEGYGQQGNHPGPLTFYLMWPVYRTFGATAWALQVATAWCQLLALGVVLWLGHRRAGPRLVVGLLVAVALVARGVGVARLVDPWNPYLSLLWWLAFLLAVWSLLGGDLPAMPVAAVAGSVCAQNHVEYVPLVAGLGGLAAVAVARAALVGAAAGREGLPAARERSSPGGPAEPREPPDGPARPEPDEGGVPLAVPVGRPAAARAVLGWTAAAVAVAAVLWAPPVLDELRRRPGNLAILAAQFRDAVGPSVGWGEGLHTLLVQADPLHLVRGTVVGEQHVAGSAVPGAVLLAAGAAAAAGAWRLRHGPLLRLHAVLGAAFALGVAAMSRVVGDVWFWLGLWAAVLAALTLLAVAWTVGAALARRRPQDRAVAGRAGAAAAGALALVLVAEAVHAQPSGEAVSARLAAVAPETIAALDAAGGPEAGERYLVTFTDPVSAGMGAFGLVDELERAGYDVGMAAPHRASVGGHRVLAPGDATGVIRLVTGPAIARWRRWPGTRLLAYADHRTARERAECERLYDGLVADLRRAGRRDLVAVIDSLLLVVAFAPTVPPAARDKARRLVDIGLPTAVFLAPAETATVPV